MIVPLLYIGNGRIAKRFCDFAGDGMTVFPDVGAASEVLHKLHKTEFIVLLEQNFAKTDVVDSWLIRTMCPEAAIVLVAKGEMDDDQRRRYADAGVTDVMAVTASAAEFEQKMKAAIVTVAPDEEAGGEEDSRAGEYVNDKRKRAFDVAYSLLMMTLLSPLMLILIIWLRLTTRGKIFVKEDRVGTNFNVFPCYGFRVFDKKEGTGGQRRLTRNGRMLLRLGMARLPMLLNVLKGDVSVVGNEPMTLERAQTMTSDENIGMFLCPFGMKDNASVLSRHLRRPLTADEKMSAEKEYAGAYCIDEDVEIFWALSLFQKGRCV